MRGPVAELFLKSLRAANAWLSRTLSMRLMRDQNLYPWQRNPSGASVQGDRKLPDGAAAYLRRDNPILVELVQRYRRFDPRVTRSAVWTDVTISDTDLAYFRGHNSFTDQLSNANELTYALSYYALKSSAAADLLARFEEDGSFGANTFEIDGRKIARDSLDSAREVEFIRTHVGWEETPLSMIDIGAGYGRLVQRLAEAGGERVSATATDAYAPSTFIADYYLRHRGLANTSVVPLDEVEEWLATVKPRLASNIHSFSECTPDAIDWWVERLARNGVEYLMVVPNSNDSATGEALTNIGESIDRIFERHGYRLAVREPHHRDPAVQKYAIDPSILGLFRLEAAR